MTNNPRGHVIRRVARDAKMGNPATATHKALIRHINGLSEEKDRQKLLDRLETELDGARPFF